MNLSQKVLVLTSNCIGVLSTFKSPQTKSRTFSAHLQRFTNPANHTCTDSTIVADPWWWRIYPDTTGWEQQRSLNFFFLPMRESKENRPSKVVYMGRTTANASRLLRCRSSRRLADEIWKFTIITIVRTFVDNKKESWPGWIDIISADMEKSGKFWGQWWVLSDELAVTKADFVEVHANHYFSGKELLLKSEIFWHNIPAASLHSTSSSIWWIHFPRNCMRQTRWKRTSTISLLRANLTEACEFLKKSNWILFKKLFFRLCKVSHSHQRQIRCHHFGRRSDCYAYWPRWTKEIARWSRCRWCGKW